MDEHTRASAPHRPIAFAPAQAQRATDPDGTIRITSPAALGAYDPSLARLVRAAVETAPARVFLQERPIPFASRHADIAEAADSAEARLARLA
jgi:hypothetical protein